MMRYHSLCALFSDYVFERVGSRVSKLTSMSSSLETQWKVEMVLRAAGLASLMATSWFIARKILPLLESATDNEDNKNKVRIHYARLIRHVSIQPAPDMTFRSVTFPRFHLVDLTLLKLLTCLRV